ITDLKTPGWGLERKLQVAFEDVALYFTREEWELLSQPEKQLYRDQMLRNYRALVFLGKDQFPLFYSQLFDLNVKLIMDRKGKTKMRFHTHNC
uniref:Uncharacterized protein n=1 Tax=Gopherus agassizii TaxID=38772 RepID=A0A452HUX3_9SAUR